jgi:hypothetical protein
MYERKTNKALQSQIGALLAAKGRWPRLKLRDAHDLVV